MLIQGQSNQQTINKELAAIQAQSNQHQAQNKELRQQVAQQAERIKALQ